MIDLNNISDFDDELDELDKLEDLFEDLDYNEPTPEQMYKMYGVFLNDFVKNPININGDNLKFNKSKSRNPICRGKFQGFEHIITRKSKLSGKRTFDKRRANKIHWIRPIIEYVKDDRIIYFERINDKGFNQQFYWYNEKQFIVIIRETQPEYFLITAFVVDDSNNKYKRYYDEYRKK